MNIPYLDLNAVTAQHRNEIQKAVARVVDSGRYLQGYEVEHFEGEFASYTNHEHCIGVANGLDALTLTLAAYKEMGRLHDGDEVIVPANTFLASVLAITANNLVPVFVEPKVDTLEIDAEKVERAFSQRTKLVMPVHLYGRNAWTDKLAEVCRQHNVIVVEDCAQAHGCKGIGKGDASCYSFYPGKNLGAFGDGGAVVTNDRELAGLVRNLANYGFVKRYVANHEGRNSRLDEIQAAVLDVKLRYLDEDNARRQSLARIYYDNINNPQVELPTLMDNDNNVYHIFPVLCTHRDDLQNHLEKAGVGTLIHYPIPPHRQLCYARYSNLHLPITEYIADAELSLPLNQTMTEQEVMYIAQAVNDYR